MRMEMPFCPHCGAPGEGNFCPACGKPSGSALPTAGLTDNQAATLCYALGLITGVVFLVLEPYSRHPKIRFHAFQSIFLNLAMVAVGVAVSLVGGVLGAGIPLLGSLVAGLAWTGLWFGSLVLWILLMLKTYQGNKIVLPILGPLAEKQAG